MEARYIFGVSFAAEGLAGIKRGLLLATEQPKYGNEQEYYETKG